MRFVILLSLTVSVVCLAADEPKQDLEATKDLFRAIEIGDFDEVKQLVGDGANVNATVHGATPWLMAGRHGFREIAEWLAEKGAKTDVKQPSLRQALQQYLGDSVGEHTPSYVILVSQDGKIVAEECFGMANIEHNLAATPDTQFLIGSVSKQFTAAAILLLQEDGKLSVQDKISKYIPNFHRGDEITLHHLLTHTSGITNYTSSQIFNLMQEMPGTEVDIIKSFQHAKLEFDPGEKFSYCNSGYFLLGHIVRKVSGKSLGDFLQGRVFKPLEMNDTGVHELRWDKPKQSMGYRVTEDGVEATKSWHMTRAGGAGAMYSTVRDLMKWNEGVFNGKVMNQSSIKAAFAPTKLNDGSESPYAYGWSIGKNRGLEQISHSGGLDGFVSYLMRLTDINVTVAVMHNAMPSYGLPSHVGYGKRSCRASVLERDGATKPAND